MTHYSPDLYPAGVRKDVEDNKAGNRFIHDAVQEFSGNTCRLVFCVDYIQENCVIVRGIKQENKQNVLHVWFSGIKLIPRWCQYQYHSLFFHKHSLCGQSLCFAPTKFMTFKRRTPTLNNF